MLAVVLGMLFCLGLAAAVLVVVAVPARREGREVLSERGEEVVGALRDRTLAGVPSLRERARGDVPDGPDVGRGGSPRA